MKRVLFVVAVTWIGVGIAVSAGQASRPAARRAPAAALQTEQQEPAPRIVRSKAQTPAAAQPQVNPAEYKAMVDRYCVGCHNARSNTPAADPLKLDQVDLAHPEDSALTFERVIRKLAVGAMPPQGLPRPEPAQLNALTGYLIHSLDRAAAARNNPGRYVLHRLNRLEYSNAIRDLVGVDFDAAEALPSDGGDFGFDNIATALKTSPLLLERYLSAALRISAMAVGDVHATPGAATFEISRERTQREHVEGLPLGTRGGGVFRYTFPADAEYQISGRLLRGIEEGYSGIEGWDRPNTFVITVDGEEVYAAPIGGTQDHTFSSADVNQSRRIIDGRMTTRAFVKAGSHDIGITWLDPGGQEQNVWQPPQRDSQEVHIVTGFPRLRQLNIQGPFNPTGVSTTRSREQIFVCAPSTPSAETPCAERIVTALARRAYRRAVTASDVEAPLAFYTETRKSGGDFDAGIRAGVARILASPSFVYRTERDPELLPVGAAHKITDVELASRLSFFLWNSIPDDRLLNLALAGQLRAPGVLPAQVARMLADPKADSMIVGFAGQWLALRSLEAKVSPDILMFPHFDDNVRKGFRRETELFFGSVLREDRSVLDLLTANYTFLNERLARYYGVSGVYGERFRKVDISDPHRRGLGLLGHGSLLSVSSVATRTSPTIRGKYILTTLMGLPAPVPPPNVPALDESAPQSATPKTTRQRVETHRTNPVCASCHKSIDPLGFALENFDSTGLWRDKDNGNPIDVSGVMADGTNIDSAAALRNWFLSHPNVFVGNVTERMLTYALGRGLEPGDMPVVRSITERSAQAGNRFHALIMGIVESAPFQMRTKPAPLGATQRASNSH